MKGSYKMKKTIISILILFSCQSLADDSDEIKKERLILTASLISFAAIAALPMELPIIGVGLIIFADDQKKSHCKSCKNLSNKHFNKGANKR
jgi:hypothetical protein